MRRVGSNLVKLVAAADEVEAQRMRWQLLAAGIHSMVRNADPLSTLHMMAPPSYSLWLYVRADDLQLATEALSADGGAAGQLPDGELESDPS